MLVACLKWRREFKADAIAEETYGAAYEGHDTWVPNGDREGRPVLFVSTATMTPDTVFQDVDTFIRWRVQTMERGMALLVCCDLLVARCTPRI